MAARILDGKALAAEVLSGIASEAARLAQRGIHPGLAAILVGDDAASRIYVRNKVRACEQTGVRSKLLELPASVTQQALASVIGELNRDTSIHGILVQLPLPKHIDAARILDAVSPDKDVDGFHPQNLGALVAGTPKLVPCTPAGVMRLLAKSSLALSGCKAVVIGR